VGFFCVFVLNIVRKSIFKLTLKWKNLKEDGAFYVLRYFYCDLSIIAFSTLCLNRITSMHAIAEILQLRETSRVINALVR